MKTVRNFGVVDVDFDVVKWEYVNGKQKVIWTHPAYVKWKNMIERCYGPPMKGRKNRYAGVRVEERWRSFSAFCSWFDLYYSDGYDVLDKDLIGDGTVYGPDTCCLIPNKLNTFLSRSEYRGILPGVSKKDDGFEGTIQKDGVTTRLTGKVYTEYDAHRPWIAAKLDHLQELMVAYKANRGKADPRVEEAVSKIASEMVDCLTNYTPYYGLSQKQEAV
ncbi:hypothetical protein P1A145kb_p208 [Pectobacterium phage DU_PP_I]|nr:hypothetical protein P1A145kb_p208 [Pectobacterium phage DU_PP_I]ATS93925.1 hypothetical protein P12B145kb_p209 [Pectobacterium phage DU_PP_IV]